MIQHIKCDIFESGADFILHQVNCQGVMNSGIAKQVREKFPIVFDAYMLICNSVTDSKELLGSAQFVNVNDKQYIVNLFGQDRYGYDGKTYTNYRALLNGFKCVAKYAQQDDVIAIPYLIGCARGGGDWNVVYKMIEEAFENYNGDVLICEYNGG